VCIQRHPNMQFVYQVILCVTVLTSTPNLTQVQVQSLNFGILDQIKSNVHKVLHNILHQPSEPSQYTSEHFPTVQPLTHGTSTYIPVSSESVQQQGMLSTLSQDSDNGTVQDAGESRSLIQAPQRCGSGYREVNGQCKKVYGRRRRRR
jgi:hypothetical protein